MEAKLCIKCGGFCKWVGKSWWIVVDSGGEWGEMWKFGWGDWGSGGKVEIGGV